MSKAAKGLFSGGQLLVRSIVVNCTNDSSVQVKGLLLATSETYALGNVTP